MSEDAYRRRYSSSNSSTGSGGAPMRPRGSGPNSPRSPRSSHYMDTPQYHSHRSGHYGDGGAIDRAKKLNYKLKDAKDWKGIMRQVDVHIESFNEVNIATALHRLAKIARDTNEKGRIIRDPRLAMLEARAQENISLFTPQQLSNSAWACATLSYPAHTLMREIEVQALLKLHKFNSQDLTNTIWAYAKLNHKPKQLMGGIASEALHKLHDFNPQGLANTLWAYATLNHFGEHYPDLLAGISREAVAKICFFNPQNLANTAWAYARLNFHPGDKLLDKVAQEAVHKITSFKPQELANLVWAYAKLDCTHVELLATVAAVAKWKLHYFNPQNLANTVWAYATLDYHPGELMDGIIAQAARCLSDFSQQGLSNTTWALAKLGHNPGDDFLMIVAYEASKKITSFSPQGLVNLAWAFATFGKFSQDLMGLVYREATCKLHAFSTHDLCNFAWACAKLGHCPKSLTLLICTAAEKKMCNLNSAKLADMIWALARLGVHETSTFVKLWDLADASVYSTRELCVISEACKIAQGETGQLPAYLNPSLFLRAQEAWHLDRQDENGVTSQLLSALAPRGQPRARGDTLSRGDTLPAGRVRSRLLGPEEADLRPGGTTGHVLPDGDILSRGDTLPASLYGPPLTQADSFKARGEDVVASVLESASPGSPTFTPFSPSQAKGRALENTWGAPHSPSSRSNTDEQSFFSLWQPSKEMPQASELITPRSNLLASLSLDDVGAAEATGGAEATSEIRSAFLK